MKNVPDALTSSAKQAIKSNRLQVLRKDARFPFVETSVFWSILPKKVGVCMVFERIQQILADQLDLPAEKITMESDILDDLEADSLDVVDLVMSIEDEYGLEVPDDHIENFRTVGDVVQFIEDNT